MAERPLVPLAVLSAAVCKQSGGRLPCTVMGPADGVSVNNIATLTKAGPTDVAFLANPRYRHQVAESQAGVIVISDEDRKAVWGEEPPARALIVTPQPYAWFAFALQVFCPPYRGVEPGVAPSAVVEPGAEVDPTASVGANAVIEAGAKVGPGAWIGSGCVVERGARIGARTQLHSNVTVAHACVVGDDCILHSGCVIGADGFGFAPFAGEWVKIPQIGRVVIGNRVEIGASTTIDRGALDDTVVEDGVILDNQIQVGHNCHIGAGTAMAGCVGVAGSARIGRNVQVGGSANIGGHLSIPDGTIVGPASNVAGNIKVAGHYTGFFPLMEHHDFERAIVLIRRLKDMRRQLRDLTARLEKLEVRG